MSTWRALPWHELTDGPVPPFHQVKRTTVRPTGPARHTAREMIERE
ncbi:hypothetical protein OG302_07180 [Streptomyces sp. NBC_01283]|nr:hypothetical protein OG302_07180 [Streptomyces sp. NBC_01283]